MHLHLDSCTLEYACDSKSTETIFPKLKNLKLSGTRGALNVLLHQAWKALETLDLQEYELNESDIKTLAEGNIKDTVKNINLTGNENISGHMNTLLSNTWHLLKIMEIEECNLTEEDISAIREAMKKGFLPSIDLTVKCLSSSGHIPVIPVICGAWRQQKELDLRKCKFSKQDLITLAEANRHDQLPVLKEINLQDNMEFSGCMNTLLSHSWPQLERLNLGGCNLIAEDIEAIVKASEKGFLRNIDLTVKSLSSGHLPVVPLMCGAWREQEVLDLRKGDKQDLITIAQCNRYDLLQSMKKINLRGNLNISGQVKTLLSYEWPSLKSLDMEECNLTRDDVSAIREADQKGFLPSIDLTVKLLQLGHIPVVPIMCGAWRHQEVLELTKCEFSEQDMITIAEANRHGLLPSVKKITGLDRVSEIKEFSAIFSQQWKSLEIIDMEGCNKYDIIAIAKANRNHLLQSMKKINLRGNLNISGQVKTLLNYKWPSLKSLDMEECNLTTNDVSAIHEAHENGFLPIIDLTVKSLSSSGHLPVVPVMCGAWRQQEILDLSKGDKQDVTTIEEANRHGLLPSVKKINFMGNKNVSGHVNTLFGNEWPGLEILNIEKCNLTPDDVITIAEANRCDRLQSVKEINMNSNKNVSGQIGGLLCTSWTVLEKLQIEECNLIQKDISAIHEAYKKGFLPSIDLAVKFQSPGHPPIVPVMCGALKQDEELDLSQSDKQDIMIIAEASRYDLLPTIKEIKGLDRVSKIQQFSALFSHAWNSLETLELRECHKQDVITIAEANRYDRLQSMKKISLRGNVNVSGQVKTLLSNKWPLLKTLEMEACDLTGDDISYIHEAHENDLLPSIDLTVKSLSGHIPVLPVMCGAWREQEVLDLRQCDKQDVITIAEANRHGLLPCVTEINLERNKNISGQLGALLGSSIWQALQRIDLYHCNLTVLDLEALREPNRSSMLPSIQQIRKVCTF